MAENKSETPSEEHRRRELYEHLYTLFKKGYKESSDLFCTIKYFLDEMSDEERLRAAQEFRPKNKFAILADIKKWLDEKNGLIFTIAEVSTICWLVEWCQLHFSRDREIESKIKQNLDPLMSKVTENQAPFLKRFCERSGSAHVQDFFVSSLENRNIIAFKEFLSLDVDVNNDAFGEPLITNACKFSSNTSSADNNTKMVKALLARGANINAVLRYPRPLVSALKNALDRYNLDLIKLLAACGANLNPTVEFVEGDPTQGCSLIEKSWENQIGANTIETTNYLLAQGAALDKKTVNFLWSKLEKFDSELKDTPPQNWSKDDLWYFLITTDRKTAPEYLKKSKQRLEKSLEQLREQLLLRSEASCWSPEEHPTLTTFSRREVVAVLALCRRESHQMFRLPFELVCEVLHRVNFSKIEYDKNGQRVSLPLLKAAREGNLEEVNKLLAAYVPRTGVDSNGNTALHLACMEKPAEVLPEQHVKIVKALLEACVGKVDCKNDSGLTPLQIAYKSKNTSIIQLLLQHGADPSRQCDVALTQTTALEKENNQPATPTAAGLQQHSVLCSRHQRPADGAATEFHL